MDWIGFLATGEGVFALLTLGFVLETIGVVVGNPGFTLARFGEGEGNIENEVIHYSSKSLTFASITFGGLAFIVAQFRGELELIRDPTFLFMFAFSLFLISYKIQVFGAAHRLAWSLQQRFFNYGILSLVVGLVIFVYQTFPELVLPAAILLVVVFGLHVIEYMDDLCHHISGEDEISDDARLCRFFK